MINHTGSNFRCLKQFSMVPKMFEPLKFDCNIHQPVCPNTKVESGSQMQKDNWASTRKTYNMWPAKIGSACAATKYGKGSRLSLFEQPRGCKRYIRPAKSDQTAQMRSLIRVFLDRTSLTVDFVVRWLECKQWRTQLTCVPVILFFHIDRSESEYPRNFSFY